MNECYLVRVMIVIAMSGVRSVLLLVLLVPERASSIEYLYHHYLQRLFINEVVAV